ncbi:MAG: hypothetical protein ACOH18_05550 [Candidatus Saccharimonadaceae bacterium]
MPAGDKVKYALMRALNPSGDAINVKTDASGNLITSGQMPAGATTSPSKVEDAVAASGDVGIFNLGVRRDAPLITSSATGDYNEQSVGKWGQTYVQTIDAAKRTFAAGFKLTPVVGTVLEIIGSASTTVEVNRITLTLYGTTAGIVDVILNKRSAASTAGTAITAPTKVTYDTSDATAAAGAIKGFTAAPTNGTLVGIIRQAMLTNIASQVSDRLKFESGTYAKSFTLIGVSQALTLELAGTLPTGATIAIDVEWTEY